MLLTQHGRRRRLVRLVEALQHRRQQPVATCRAARRPHADRACGTSQISRDPIGGVAGDHARAARRSRSVCCRDVRPRRTSPVAISSRSSAFISARFVPVRGARWTSASRATGVGRGSTASIARRVGAAHAGRASAPTAPSASRRRCGPTGRSRRSGRRRCTSRAARRCRTTPSTPPPPSPCTAGCCRPCAACRCRPCRSRRACSTPPGPADRSCRSRSGPSRPARQQAPGTARRSRPIAVSQSRLHEAGPRRGPAAGSAGPATSFACQPNRSFGSEPAPVHPIPARPRTPTIRPSRTAKSSASPLLCSTDADCTHRSTSSVGDPCGQVLINPDRPAALPHAIVRGRAHTECEDPTHQRSCPPPRLLSSDRRRGTHRFRPANRRRPGTPSPAAHVEMIEIRPLTSRTPVGSWTARRCFADGRLAWCRSRVASSRNWPAPPTGSCTSPCRSSRRV